MLYLVIDVIIGFLILVLFIYATLKNRKTFKYASRNRRKLEALEKLILENISKEQLRLKDLINQQNESNKEMHQRSEAKVDFIYKLLSSSKNPLKVNSPSLEDIFIYDFFSGKPGFFIEVGAFNGLDNSVSFMLEQLGWQGILVEAHPDLAKECVTNRPGSSVIQKALVTPDLSNQELMFDCVDTIEGPGHGSKLTIKTSDKLTILDNNKAIRSLLVTTVTINELLKLIHNKLINVLIMNVLSDDLREFSCFNETSHQDLPTLVLLKSKNTDLCQNFINHYPYMLIKVSQSYFIFKIKSHS